MLFCFLVHLHKMLCSWNQSGPFFHCYACTEKVNTWENVSRCFFPRYSRARDKCWVCFRSCENGVFTLYLTVFNYVFVLKESNVPSVSSLSLLNIAFSKGKSSIIRKHNGLHTDRYPKPIYMKMPTFQSKTFFHCFIYCM